MLYANKHFCFTIFLVPSTIQSYKGIVRIHTSELYSVPMSSAPPNVQVKRGEIMITIYSIVAGGSLSPSDFS